jgi:hypothetical protein
MSAKDLRLIIGGPPRADLLPPEIKVEEAARSQRRGLILIVVLIIGLVAAGYVLAAINLSSAQTRLDQVTSRTSELLSEQAKYAEVRQINTQLETAKAAREVGTSTEIDWTTYFVALGKTQPPGSVILSLEIDSATPLAEFPQSDAPLEPTRIAEFVFSATVASLEDIPTWLDDLSKLPGWVDASTNTIDIDPTGGYTVTLTMHVDQGALSGRFAKGSDN